jgi:hypothetical protein
VWHPAEGDASAEDAVGERLGTDGVGENEADERSAAEAGLECIEEFCEGRVHAGRAISSLVESVRGFLERGDIADAEDGDVLIDAFHETGEGLSGAEFDESREAL